MNSTKANLVLATIASALWLLSPANTIEAAEKLPLSTGPGYYAILPGKVLLTSSLTNGSPLEKINWSKQSGPGEVTFERPSSPITWATVSAPGKYVFRVDAASGEKSADAAITVNVYPPGDYFGNPILPGMFPDPHILFDEGTFYIFATSMENAAGAYGRASVWYSRDFVNWEMKLTDWPVYGKFGGDIWAPDVLKKEGKFYQFVTRSGSYDTWIGIADHPLGPWKNLRADNTPIVSGGGKAGRIVAAYNMDAQPFMDDDGQVYMYWGWSEAMAARLTPDLKEIDGPVHFLKGTKWLPSGGDLPQWLTVDLGISMPITRVISNPEFRDVAYGYKLEVSADNQNWRVFADRTGNRTFKAGDGYTDQGNSNGRYVRITMTHCSGHWAGLYNFQVFSGEKLVSENKPCTASSVRGKGSEPENAVDSSTGPYLSDFVEGSYMIKRHGTYYLLYSSGVLHDGTYSVHYAIGKHPLGPFITPANNVLLSSNDDLTTKGPGHNSILRFQGQDYIVYHQHNQPHEDAGGVFRQTSADKMIFNPDGTIKKVIPTQTGVGPLQKLVREPGKDVARGKYATATSVKSAAYAPEFVLDHNNASRWRATTNDYPQSLTVDLDGTFEISRIETCFEYPTLSYRYALHTSLDGKDWKVFADKSSTFETATSPRRDNGDTKAAYVRITIHGCERPENGAGIYNLKVFAEEL